MYFKYPKLHDTDWLREKIRTTPLRKIADEIGCSYSAVVYLSRKHGIVVPARRIHIVGRDWSQKCREVHYKKYPNGRLGKEAANWRGGKQHTSAGYMYISAKDHPHANHQGYVLEHRLVMEKYLGRYLDPIEAVHHKNGIKTDNRIENLQLMKDAGANIKEHFRSSHDNIHLRRFIQNKGLWEEYEKSLLASST